MGRDAWVGGCCRMGLSWLLLLAAALCLLLRLFAFALLAGLAGAVGPGCRVSCMLLGVWCGVRWGLQQIDEDTTLPPPPMCIVCETLIPYTQDVCEICFPKCGLFCNNCYTKLNKENTCPKCNSQESTTNHEQNDILTEHTQETDNLIAPPVPREDETGTNTTATTQFQPVRQQAQMHNATNFDDPDFDEIEEAMSFYQDSMQNQNITNEETEKSSNTCNICNQQLYAHSRCTSCYCKNCSHQLNNAKQCVICLASEHRRKSQHIFNIIIDECHPKFKTLPTKSQTLIPERKRPRLLVDELDIIRAKNKTIKLQTTEITNKATTQPKPVPKTLLVDELDMIRAQRKATDQTSTMHVAKPLAKPPQRQESKAAPKAAQVSLDLILYTQARQPFSIPTPLPQLQPPPPPKPRPPRKPRGEGPARKTYQLPKDINLHKSVVPLSIYYEYLK